MSKAKKVLLVGGSGFIGTHLAKALLESGHEVVIYDTRLHLELADNPVRRSYLEALYKARHDYLSDYWDKSARYALQGDSLNTIIRKGDFDHVIHMGDYSSQRMASVNPERTIRSTIDNALTLRENLKYIKGRVIYFSSSMVYGDFESFVREEDPLKPMGYYAITRLSGEEILTSRTRVEPKVVIVRPSAVFGPLDSDDRVIGKFIRSVLDNREFEVRGGSMVLDFTPVEVVVQKVMKILKADHVKYNVYNVTTSDQTRENLTLEAAAWAVLSNGPSIAPVPVFTDHEKDWPVRGLLSRASFDNEFGPVEMEINLRASIKKTYQWRKEFRDVTGY